MDDLIEALRVRVAELERERDEAKNAALVAMKNLVPKYERDDAEMDAEIQRARADGYFRTVALLKEQVSGLCVALRDAQMGGTCGHPDNDPDDSALAVCGRPVPCERHPIAHTTKCPHCGEPMRLECSSCPHVEAKTNDPDAVKLALNEVLCRLGDHSVADQGREYLASLSVEDLHAKIWDLVGWLEERARHGGHRAAPRRKCFCELGVTCSHCLEATR